MYKDISIVEKTLPLVSIIVRTKDRPELLQKALKSIFAQTYRPIEVVLINDGGCDLQEDNLKSILGDITLNYVRLETNMGRAHAGNIGIENTKGDYIGFLDDDDELLPEHIALLTDFLCNGGNKVAYSDAFMVYKELVPHTQELQEVGRRVTYSEDFNFNQLIIDNYIPFMCLLFSKNVFTSSIRFDTGFELYEDWDLLIRIAEKNQFHHVKQTTAENNQWSSAAQIAQENKDKKFVRASYLKLYSKHFDKFNPERIYDIIDLNREQYICIRNLEAFIKEKNKDIEIGSLKDYAKNKDFYIKTLESSAKDMDAYTFANKTEECLRRISTNIIPAEPTTEGLERALIRAVHECEDYDSRIQGANVHWSQSWENTFNNEKLTKIKKFVDDVMNAK